MIRDSGEHLLHQTSKVNLEPKNVQVQFSFWKQRFMLVSKTPVHFLISNGALEEECKQSA